MMRHGILGDRDGGSIAGKQTEDHSQVKMRAGNTLNALSRN
jgi:hypothetical protein